MRVLAFTPTYGDGPRPETIASVQAQQFAGEMTYEVSWHNPHPGADVRNVMAQFYRAHDMTLKGKYDALWIVEHDMLVPPDALQKLWDTEALVAYGPYILRHGMRILSTWSIRTSGRSLGFSLSTVPDKLEQALDLGIVPVGGVGFGCLLIRLIVFGHVRFRPGGNDGTAPPDIPFAQDCIRSHIGQVAHFGVPCGHWDGAKWLMPPTRG